MVITNVLVNVVTVVSHAVHIVFSVIGGHYIQLASETAVNSPLYTVIVLGRISWRSQTMS